MKKLLFIIAALLLGTAQVAQAWTSYNYVSADQLKGWLEAAKPVLLVDIQEKKDFTAHHIKNSLETNGYPVKSDHDRQTLDPALKLIQAHNYEAVVVVCPRGKGGAKRAYEYLAAKGVAEAKLFILTGGMEKWPHREWVAAN
ncbi:MAG: rhodanese-like domain-containing protein [Desulfobulbaceae bacterium]|nr:rhodanese-like domain-containing protein [Desulfobulbaceae bacterium]HIJ78950.1 rhodanese-like domain-containing protein [Deltaproteobacteria bacterium]